MVNYSKYLTASESMGYIIRVRVLYAILQVKAVGSKDSPCACEPELAGGCRVRAAG